MSYVKKHFILVSQTWTAKNKLQRELLKNLEPLNQTLTESQGQAVKLIQTAYEKTLSEYKGKATVPELRIYEPGTGKSGMFIQDLIRLMIYEVKKEPNNE